MSEAFAGVLGIVLAAVYFVRRFYWLSRGNYHNWATRDHEMADKEVDKAHDYLSWLLLGASACFLLYAL